MPADTSARPGGSEESRETPDGGTDLARRYRREFPIFDSKIYLNSNSLGALSRRSLEQRRVFERQWNEFGASAWHERWLAKLADVREAFARTIGARADEIALMPSVSAALAAVAGALDLGAGSRVVLTELDFPTLAHQFLSRRRRGLETVLLESPDGVEVPPHAFEAAVDEKTALVATSHVCFTTGAIQDARRIAEIARARGALFFLDAYQSHGQIPLDVGELRPDFLVSGALKWLLGGPGLAFLYVRPELAGRLAPTTLSWFGVEDQFDFDPEGATPRAGARRFEMGTPAVGAAFTAAGGLEMIEEIGIQAIRRRNARLAEDLIERLRERGFEPRVAPVSSRRSALVPVRHPRPEEAAERLAARGIVADARPGLVRLSPHFYNTVEDGARAVEALGDYGKSIG